MLLPALKIHCSSECKALLDRLGGYTVIKRGVIGMKGKGEVLTYWLVGEESLHRARRSEERARRRELSRKDAPGRKSKSCKTETCLNGGSVANNIHQAPRSSLKNKNSLSCPRNVVARCVSLESPKKLRFANGGMLDCNPYHKCSHDPIVDVIFSDIPSKRRPSKVVEQGDEFADGAMSVSCPCIENITLSNVAKEGSRIKIGLDDSEYDNSCSNSEPLLLTSSIPCISITSDRDMQNSKHISDINIPLLQNYCSSAS